MVSYRVQEEDKIFSPSLIYYKDIIQKNTARIIDLAGGPERLWPHIKTHKSLDMTRYLISCGITKFKAATIAETEMVCMAGASKVLLAYELIGPNIDRLLALSQAYPATMVYAMEDDLEEFQHLSHKCVEQKTVLPVLIDVDMGQHRTGVSLEEVPDLVHRVSRLPGLRMEGFHCYDGHRHEKDLAERDKAVAQTDEKVQKVLEVLRQEGYTLPVVIAGGTPSFPCHARHTDWFLSPGTSFVHDAGYEKNFPDLGCRPGAAVLTRVISHPTPHTFTIDLGYKGVCADPAGERGELVGYPHARTVMQNEEHWVLELPENEPVPPVGTVLYVIPTHICPTTALYPEILVAQNGRITGTWPVTARNRKIRF